MGEVTLSPLPSSYPAEETAPHTGSRSRSVRLSLLLNASKTVPVRVDLFSIYSLVFLVFHAPTRGNVPPIRRDTSVVDDRILKVRDRTH